MAFRNPPVNGSILTRPAIQSPNYVLGSTGWTVNRDGTAELNSGTFRGSLSVGSSSSPHFTVNNTATGDPMDVYDSAGDLIFVITNQGLVAAYATGSSPAASVGMQNAKLLFSDNATPTAHTSAMSFTPATVPAGQGQITILNSGYTGDVGSLEILCGSADGSKRPTVQANERGHQGSVMVSDQVSKNNLVHVIPRAVYSTDVNGIATIPHGASFTPDEAFAQQTGTSGSGTVTFVSIDGSFTSSQFQVKVFLNGSAFASNNFAAAFVCYG